MVIHFGDHNRSNIGGTMKAAAAEAKASNAASKARFLEARLEKTSMILEALWIIVREKLDLTDELLEKAITAVDLQDGKLDGKVVREVTECPSCSRTIGRGRSQCVYCGTQVSGDLFR